MYMKEVVIVGEVKVSIKNNRASGTDTPSCFLKKSQNKRITYTTNEATRHQNINHQVIVVVKSEKGQPTHRKSNMMIEPYENIEEEVVLVPSCW